MEGGRGGRLQALEGGNRIAPEESGARRRADGKREDDNSEYCGRRARDLPERKWEGGGLRKDSARWRRRVQPACQRRDCSGSRRDATRAVAEASF